MNEETKLIDKQSKSISSELVKIERHFFLPFPVRIIDEDLPDPIVLSLTGKELRPQTINGKKVSKSYQGQIQIFFPEFKPTPTDKNKDTSGACFDKNKKPLKNLRANYIKMRLEVSRKDYLDYQSDLKLDRLSPNEREEIMKNDLYGHNHLFLDAIFELYLHAALRWIRVRSEQFWIGHPMPADLYSGISAFLSPDDLKPKHAVTTYQGGQFGRLITHTPLNREIWDVIKQDLKSSAEPYLYELLLLDAKYYNAMDDYRRAILDLATCFEVYSLEYLRHHGITESDIENKKKEKQKKDENSSLVDVVIFYIDKIKSSLYRSTQEDDYLHLRFLYEARNKIIHQGFGDGDQIEISYDLMTTKGKLSKKKIKWKIHWDLVYDGLESLERFIVWTKKSESVPVL